MKFEIDRASSISNSKSPIDGAVFEKASNRYQEDHWYIEISSLDDLIKLNDKYGDIILMQKGIHTNNRRIVIYDDYVE